MAYLRPSRQGVGISSRTLKMEAALESMKTNVMKPHREYRRLAHVIASMEATIADLEALKANEERQWQQQ